MGIGVIETRIHALDCGIIYFDSNKKFVLAFFNQDNGRIEDLKIYNHDIIHTQKCELSVLGEYIYYTSSKYGSLKRIKFNDLEKETITNIETLSPEIKNVYDIRTGIDGNLYIRTLDKTIWAVYNADNDTPKLVLLYDNIPNANIHFPNYLYQCELFSCNTSCDRSATFYFPNRNNEIVTFEWDFGDGQKSNIQNPIHYYKKAGIYTVSLKCTLKNGSIKYIPSRRIKIIDIIKKPNIIAE